MTPTGTTMFTAQASTAGHPDKLCDRISDTIVGRVLRQDPLGGVTAECAVSTGIVFVSVKLAADAVIDLPLAARDVLLELGYDRGDMNAATCTVMTTLSDQRRGTRRDERAIEAEAYDAVVATEQVTCFGFACRQSPGLVPLPLWLARRLARRLAEVERRGELPWLSPDAKTQVGVEYDGLVPRRLHSVTLLAGHRAEADVALEGLRGALLEHVLWPAFEDEPVRPDDRTRIAVNPEGLVVGGPARHAGLTGRKAAEDVHGEYARCGTAALSGKDPARIDRIGAYAARHAARLVVAAGLAEECEVMLSYAVGLAAPVAVAVRCRGARLDDDAVAARVRATLDFRPAAIVRRFGLRDLAASADDGFWPRLAAYGHVGRTDLALPWEDDTGADALR